MPASSNQKPEAATAQWSSVQTMLEEADSDVLILLDCCAAASSAGGSGRGVTELIAACGFESNAPGVGEHSFTRSLIEELKYYGQRPGFISSAFLHNKVLARAMRSWNPRYESEGAQERRRTPIHIHLADQSEQWCIELMPLPILPSSVPHQTPSSTGSSAPSAENVDEPEPSDSSQSSLTEAWPNPAFDLPKVLVSIALEEEQILRTGDWIEWLKSIPALADSVRIESVYKSNSTLLLLSLPVAIWDMLPKDPAISFISFVKSCNLLHTDAQKRTKGGSRLSEQLQKRSMNRLPTLPPGLSNDVSMWLTSPALGDTRQTTKSTFHVSSGVEESLPPRMTFGSSAMLKPQSASLDSGVNVDSVPSTPPPQSPEVSPSSD
ncbi:MAG: hypothetical protein Q9207_003266 [Kuettlingeria erythrocarpa]